MAKAKPKKTEPPADPAALRRARLASFEAERKREQRRRTVILLAICVVLAGALLAYPVFLFVADYRARSATIADLGVSVAEASCDPVSERAATGNQDHVPEGTDVDYDSEPPGTGPHYDSPAPFTKRFYTPDDRSAVETLVHNLEHGYTVVWYRDSAPADQVEELEAISKTFASDDYDPTKKFIAAPWTQADGPFPEGKNVVMTRWYADPRDPTNTALQKGVRQACGAVSGPAIAEFMGQFPYTDSPEPNGA